MVLEDLHYLSEHWRDGLLDDAHLRRDSTTLRKLLLDERVLQRTWNDLRGTRKYTIYSLRLPDLDKEMPSLLDGLVLFGGGLVHQGPSERSDSVILAPPEDQLQEMSAEERAALNPEGKLIHWPMSLTQFIGGRFLYAGRQVVTREQLIRFVANKLGGSHYDPRRDNAVQMALDNLMSQNIVIGGAHGSLYSMLLSVVQDLCESPDTKELIETIEALY